MSGPGIIEATFVHEWLHATLDGDAALRALLGVAVGDTRVSVAPAPEAWDRGPFVTYEAQTPMRDVRGSGNVRIMSDGLWQVKGVMATATYDDLADIAARIDVLLDGVTDHVVGVGTILTCHREEGVHYPETDRAVEWRHLGGLYRIRAQ